MACSIYFTGSQCDQVFFLSKRQISVVKSPKVTSLWEFLKTVLKVAKYKVVTDFFFGVVGESAEIFILLCHLAELLLCVDDNFRSFQKSFVNFCTCSLKNFVVYSSIELQFFAVFSNFLVNSVSRCYFGMTKRWK